jgi:hypothetical protein
MPVVSANARAKITAIFFMSVSPLLLITTLQELAKGIRDRHHTLELFACSIDLRYDRHDGHASCKDEGKDHGHEYLFHWSKPSVGASDACSPLPQTAFKRLDGISLVLH